MPTLLNALRTRLACVPGRSPALTALPDKLTGAPPAVFATDDWRIEVGILKPDAATTFSDISIIDSLTVRVKTSQVSEDSLLEKTVAAGSLNQSLVQADWDAGTDQHAVAEFTHDETNLDLASAPSKAYWLEVFYLTTDSPAKQVTIYSGPITFYAPKIPTNVGPISAASIIPTGAVYSGAGAYTLTVIDGRRYTWTKGANDTNIVVDGTTYTSTVNFTAVGTSVVLHGTNSAVITANVKPISSLSMDEADARYLRGLRWLGSWSNAANYVANDAVAYDGSSWYAKRSNLNVTPVVGADWGLVAQKGDTGATGDTGSTGATGAGYGGTSTTSLVIASSGSKAFTTQAGLAYTNGARVRASSAANAANWMEGTVTYSGTTLTMTVDRSHGSGTHADWNLNVAGDTGDKGDKGDTGDTGATGNTGATGAGYGGTSTTSLVIASSGSKAFTTQAGLAYTNGARVRASSAADATNWMEGTVTYSGTTLTMTVDRSHGSGTHADWNLNVAGDTGDTGATGAAAYVYVAYASDSGGTGFTTTFNAALNYIAVKHTTSPISSPQASDFAGLWKNYKGATGNNGQNADPITVSVGEDVTDRMLVYQDLLNLRGNGAGLWYAVDLSASPARYSSRLGIALNAAFSGTNNIVPTMTDANSPSGLAVASSAVATFDAWKAFDGDGATYWKSVSEVNGAWLYYLYAAAKTVASYKLTCLGATDAPTDFTLQGSNDGINWSTVDTRAGLTWSAGETKTFTCASPASYFYYRLYCTANGGASYIAIKTWQMFLAATTADVQVNITRIDGFSGLTANARLWAGTTAGSLADARSSAGVPNLCVGVVDATDTIWFNPFLEVGGETLLWRSSPSSPSAVSGLTETTVATVTVPELGANDELQFAALLTRPASQTANTLLNVYFGGSLIAVHTIDASPFTVIPMQHLLSNKGATNAQLGGSDGSGTLLTGSVDTTASASLVFKLQNGDSGDATTLRSLTVKRISG